jgi:hypothetical protein
MTLVVRHSSSIRRQDALARKLKEKIALAKREWGYFFIFFAQKSAEHKPTQTFCDTDLCHQPTAENFQHKLFAE